LDAVLGLLDLGRPLADGRSEPLERFAQNVGPVERAPDPTVESLTLTQVPPCRLLEEIVGGHAGMLDQVHGLLKPVKRQQALAAAVVVQARQRDIDPDVRDLQPHVLAGHGLERVRLVKNCHVVLGKHPEARSARSVTKRAWLTINKLADQTRRRAWK